jgi:hypothetical protein
MYYVTCPKCAAKNAGYLIQCVSCGTSLVKLPRVKAKERDDIAGRPHVYNSIRYESEGDQPIHLMFPENHCYYCDSSEPTNHVPFSVTSGNPNIVRTGSGIGHELVTTSKSLSFQIPLCANCKAAYNLTYCDLPINVDDRYNPGLYDPTFKQHPTLKLIAHYSAWIFGITLTVVVLFFLIRLLPFIQRAQVKSIEVTSVLNIIHLSLLVIAGISLIIWRLFHSIAGSHDKELRTGLIADAKSDYPWPAFGELSSSKGNFTWDNDVIVFSYTIKLCNRRYMDLFYGLNPDLK